MKKTGIHWWPNLWVNPMWGWVKTWISIWGDEHLGSWSNWSVVVSAWLEAISWRQGPFSQAKIPIEIRLQVGRLCHWLQGPHKWLYLSLLTYPAVHHETSSWQGDPGAASGLHRRNREVVLARLVFCQRMALVQDRGRKRANIFFLSKHQNHSAIVLEVQVFDYFEPALNGMKTNMDGICPRSRGWFQSFFLAIHEQMICWESQADPAGPAVSISRWNREGHPADCWMSSHFIWCSLSLKLLIASHCHAICVIPSHLISRCVIPAFFISCHLISCLLSLPQLFLADHNS